MEAAFVTPAALRTMGAQVEQQFAVAERAARGITTAMDVAFATPASLKSLGTGIVDTLKKSGEEGSSALASRITAATSAASRAPATGLATAGAAAGQVDVGAWLQARKPSNEVDAEAWNKARQGTESLRDRFISLFTTAKSGAGDIREAAAATDELGHAHTRTTGTSSRMREGLVLVHEFLRGDWKRGVGSATIELQNFGALGYVFNPITLGLTAAAGAMAVLIARSAEIDANIRSFDATLRVMGTGSQASGADLEKTAENLKHLGISADEAHKSVIGIARTPGLNLAFRDQLGDIGTRISQYVGGAASAHVEELVKATQGGIEGLIQFGAAYNAFSLDEINALRELDRAGLSQAGDHQSARHSRPSIAAHQRSAERFRQNRPGIQKFLG